MFDFATKCANCGKVYGDHYGESCYKNSEDSRFAPALPYARIFADIAAECERQTATGVLGYGAADRDALLFDAARCVRALEALDRKAAATERPQMSDDDAEDYRVQEREHDEERAAHMSGPDEEC